MFGDTFSRQRATLALIQRQLENLSPIFTLLFSGSVSTSLVIGAECTVGLSEIFA